MGKNSNKTSPMHSKPQTIHLKVQIDAREYILGTLSFNIEKNELAYLINWPKEIPKYQLNLNTDENTPPLHHLTFHKSVAQIRLKAYTNEKKFKPQLQKDIDLMASINDPQILFVESFIFKDNNIDILAESSETTACYEKSISYFEKPKNFSLIFLLIPSHIDTNDLFTYYNIFFQNLEINLKQLLKAGHSLGRIEAFEDMDAIVFITPFSPDIITIQKIPNSSIRALNYDQPLQSIIKILDKMFMPYKK
jgi:hypothetical protein